MCLRAPGSKSRQGGADAPAIQHINAQPVEFLRFIGVLEHALGKEVIKQFELMQLGDLLATTADTSALLSWVGSRPGRQLEQRLSVLLPVVADLSFSIALGSELHDNHD